jgi:hypothetical protein
MDPATSPEEQLFTAPDGVERPMRVAAESFFAYSVFGESAEAEAYGRISGPIIAVETRTNSVTGLKFLVCRVACLGFEVDVLTIVPEGALPRPGFLLASEAFFIASIDDLPWPRPGLFRR